MGSMIFFDGVCGLCNATVDFVLRHDTQAVFQFSPLQARPPANLSPRICGNDWTLWFCSRIEEPMSGLLQLFVSSGV